jgi:phospholipase/carboxylesterase
MSAAKDQILEATTQLLGPLLTGMEMLGHAGRHLHPPNLPDLVDAVAPYRQPLADQLEQFEAIEWPAHLADFHDYLRSAADFTLQGYDGLATCSSDVNPIIGAYRSMRFNTRAMEALYPVAAMLPPISRFFLDDLHREDGALLDRLAQSDASQPDRGVIHAGNGPDDRGGFSLYVPEYYDGKAEWPLIIAMHGGSGHGRDFLWTWLREARSSGAFLVSATSRDRTWSLMGPDKDSTNLNAMIEHVATNYHLDRSRILLTGMSDGGTFTMLSGLLGGVPATHLAPISSAFHPVLLQGAKPERLTDLPVYLTHGTLDWMFAIDGARVAQQALRDAGAKVEFREIEDLSHTYPREENTRIMNWFLNGT